MGALNGLIYPVAPNKFTRPLSSAHDSSVSQTPQRPVPSALTDSLDLADAEPSVLISGLRSQPGRLTLQDLPVGFVNGHRGRRRRRLLGALSPTLRPSSLTAMASPTAPVMPSTFPSAAGGGSPRPSPLRWCCPVCGDPLVLPFNRSPLTSQYGHQLADAPAQIPACGATDPVTPYWRVFFREKGAVRPGFVDRYGCLVTPCSALRFLHITNSLSTKVEHGSRPLPVTRATRPRSLWACYFSRLPRAAGTP